MNSQLSQFEEIAINLDELPRLPYLQDNIEQIEENNENPIDKVTSKLHRFIFKDDLLTRKHKWLYYPTFTIIVTLVELALLIWTLSIDGFVSPSENPMLGPSAQTLLDAGGKWTPYILERGEWWRLISAMFLHAGILHFVTNAIVQLFMTGIIEIRYGTIITASVYILTGISGNVWSAIFVPQFITVGASGALFGIIGIWCVEIVKHFRILMYPCATLTGMIISMVFSFAMGLLPYVDNFAHFGGFIGGIFLGIFLVPSLKTENLCRRRTGFIIRAIGCIMFVGMFVGMFLVLYLVEESVTVWCEWCQYFNCIPNNVDGANWCGTI